MEHTDENASCNKENIDIKKNPINNKENGDSDHSNDSEDASDSEACGDLPSIKRVFVSILQRFRRVTEEFESKRSVLNFMTDHGSPSKVQVINEQLENVRSSLSYIEREIGLLGDIDDSIKTRSSKRYALFTEEKVCENINKEIQNINEYLKVVQEEFKKVFGIEKFFKNL